MSFMSFFKRPDINEGVEDWLGTEDAVLLDVRTVEEYREGHIEGSVNIPLQNIHAVKNNLPDLDKPIYVHCLSGARSAQATSVLKSMGYTNVTDIGGINSYRGKVVK
ncbi:rhodanese-like domain-containing protein [Ruminococcus sp.]|uniref:rhodanese-like domain-containing protein n=1 Tax=Ruminococcus sp. TaxID=41978 RepID=UPI003F013C11